MLVMIYHNSTDPVLIKKIPLRIWTLRDELEAVIQQRLESGEYTAENKPSLDDLIEEYRTKEPLKEQKTEQSARLKLVEEDTLKTASEDSEQEEQSTNHNVEIIQRRPKIAEDRLYGGTLVLAELEMDHLYFFTNKQFTVGQSIVIEFMVPKRFSMNVDVVYCRAFNMKSRIISNHNYRYRIAARFTFLKEGERTLLRQFIKSVEPTPPNADTPKSAAKPEASVDEFSELDDLDI